MASPERQFQVLGCIPHDCELLFGHGSDRAWFFNLLAMFNLSWDLSCPSEDAIQ
jgi:hypothetical protein